MNSKLFIPFNVRNQIINENCSGNKDITDFDSKDHYSILSSYMKEKDIFNAFNKRMFDGIIKKKNVSFGVSYDNFKKGISDSIQDIKYTIEHPYASLNCGFIINPYRFTVVGFDDTSLKAYWKFNEASGDIINLSQSAVDLGSAADLQVTGATYGATGIIGDALSFDGVNDFADSGTSVSQYNYIHEGQSTICFWMKYGSTPGSGEDIFENANRSFGRGFGVLTNTDARLTYQITNGSAAVFEHNAGASYIPDNTNYYFYVLRSDVDITTDTSKIRRDNGNEVTKNRSNAPATGNAVEPLCVASFNSGAGEFGDFDIDETSFWNKIMSASDETDLYNGGAGLEIY